MPAGITEINLRGPPPIASLLSTNLDPSPLWPPAPYGPMAKPYHPYYTIVNPAEEARRYTSEKVYCRKLTLVYDWLPPGREVQSWFRRVPWQLERGEMVNSWIVKYFEFRAAIGPLPRVGFIGDLWISWNARDPSIWFKVDETKWERWGGCASSLRERMNAKHPFLDKAYLWFSPRNFFFTDTLPDTKLSLRWDRWSVIQRVVPRSRMIDPDSTTPPRRVPDNPLYLPSMRTIVRALCPGMVQHKSVSPAPIPVDDREDDHSGTAVVNTSTGRTEVEDLPGSPVMEEIVIGDDVEIDWDWWGSSDNETGGGTTEVGVPQPQPRCPTPTPPTVTPSRNSRYHPYRYVPPPTTPFSKFKPPARYTQGTLDQKTSPKYPSNTPVSSLASTSSTPISTTMATPRLTSGSINLVLTDDKEVVGLREQAVTRGETPHPKKLSSQTLEGVMRILSEDGYNQSGVWAVIPPELSDAGGDLAAELPVPILELGRQTLQKVRRLLRQDGFGQNGILVLNMRKPSDDDEAWDDYNEMETEDIIRAWI